MALKLWITVLLSVSSMTQLSTQMSFDLSSIMGTTTTVAPIGSDGYDNYGQPQKHKGGKQDHLGKPLGKFDLKDELKKLENIHEDKFKLDKVKKPDNTMEYGYNVTKVAHPVENPIYSTYTPTTSYNTYGQNYGQSYGQSYGQNYGQKSGQPNYRTPSYNNLTGYNVYREMYGYNNQSPQPNYPPTQVRPQNYDQPQYQQAQPQYPNNGYSSPVPNVNYNSPQTYSAPNTAPNYGASPPSYGASPPSYGASPPSYGASPPSYGASPPSYGASPPSYGVSAPNYSPSAPLYDSGYHSDHGYSGPDSGYIQEEHNYHQPQAPAYNPGYSPAPIDYSKYISPMPYSELSEYISPAQYNEYTGMIYQAYNVPAPQPSYQRAYSKNNYTNKYNKNFQMVVAVVVINGLLGAHHDYKGSGYAKRDLANKPDLSFSKKGDEFEKHEKGNVQGTIFITEIDPYVILVSGVVSGLPPMSKFGIAIYTFGDLTNGCNSIGEHYNPTHKNHGNINFVQSHVGDLGNVVSDEKGVAFVNKISKNQFTIQGINAVAGRALGICKNQDDLGLGGTVESLKNGNCGFVQACGIIGLSNTGAPHSNSGHY